MEIRNLSRQSSGTMIVASPSLGLPMPVLLVVTLLMIGSAPSASAQYGIADRVGQALENAGRNVRMGVQNAVEAGRGGIPVVAYENPLVARVYARLQWEKLLAGSTLELEVRDDGTAFLRGEVASKEAKERAFLLARDTVGINKVIDELVVPTSTSVKGMTPDSRVAPDPLPAAPLPSPPVEGPAALIRVRPARVRGRLPVGSTTVVVPGARVVVPAPAPAAADVIVTP